MYVLFLFCFIFFSSVKGDEESNLTYTIIAPKTLRVNSTYVLSVTTKDTGDSSATFEFKAAINNHRGNKLVGMKEKLNIGSTSLITLKIPAELNNKDYTLVVSGSGPITFNDSHVVTVNRKYMSIFVQTDKAMYKPGQKVLFRAIAMYSDLKPFVGLINISIFDADQNKILQLLDQHTDIGVVSANLSLSDQTILGDWMIEVVTKLAKYEKKFTVAEYVLPKFEVKVNGPTFYLTNIDHGTPKPLKVSVTAKYTYGKNVEGSAVVKFRLYSDYSYADNRYKNRTIAMSVQLVDGKTDVSLPFESLMLLSGEELRPESPSFKYHEVFHSRILVVANVTETATSKSLSGQVIIPSTVNKYKIQILDISPSNYKPDITYRGFIKLSQFDESPPSPHDIEHGVIELTTEKFLPYDHQAPTTPSDLRTATNISITESGYIHFDIDVESGFRSISISVKFLHPIYSTVQASKYVEPFTSRANHGITISFLNPKGTIQPGSTEIFLVKTTKPVSSYYYQMLSKGMLLRSMKEEMKDEALESTFSVHFTEELCLQLSPELLILVHCVTNNGEIIADSLTISIQNSFRNKVSLSFDGETRGPGEEVGLKVTAHPNSYIGILAVDQSVRLLKDGNDIQKEMVYDEMRTYEKSQPSQQFYCWWWPRSRGGADTYDILENSGVFVLTNGYVHRHEFLDYYYDHNMDVSVLVGMDQEEIMDTSKYTTFSVRRNFPETWIWQQINAGESGEFELKTKVPDTITSWVASAFAMNHQVGFGVSEEVAKVTVFKPFFVSPNLPYSIIRGEEFAMQVTIFNYLTEDILTTVTVPQSTYFKGIAMSNSIEQMFDKKTEFMDLKEVISVPSNGVRSVFFWIVPVELGEIEIEVRADANIAADAARVKLLVKPEGIREEYSTSLLLGTEDAEEVELAVSLPPEENLVPGSATIRVTLIGDVMGASLNGLGSLLAMPYGCGEQNMLNFAPDIYIMQYLTASNMLQLDIATKAMEYMLAGYQKELTFQRIDGSFSAFGNSDKSGSVWLSAFVAKCFKQAAGYIAVEDVKIAETLKWIISHQAQDGSFAEPPEGRVLHSDMQGGSSKGLSMTAYVLIALLQNNNNSALDKELLIGAITKAVLYLKTKLSTVSTDAYALSIISYATLLHHQATASTASNDAFNLLKQLAIDKDGMMYWTRKLETVETASDDEWQTPYPQSKSVDIEMTSYALLCYATMKDVSGGLPILRWILKQRNANGGFSSTQDTVMGLEALAKFTELVSRPKDGENMKVTLRPSPGNGDLIFQDINQQNSLVLQTIEIAEKVSSIKVFSIGSGVAVVQLNVAYNVYTTHDDSALELTVDTNFDNVTETVRVRSCGKWMGGETSGMVIMEIGQLTGYDVENEEEVRQQMGSILKKVEADDGKLVLYLDQLDSNEICAEVKSRKTRSVGNVQDAPVSVYRYYEPKIASRVMYSDLSASNEEFKSRMLEVATEQSGANLYPSIVIFSIISVLLSTLTIASIFA